MWLMFSANICQNNITRYLKAPSSFYALTYSEVELYEN